MTTHSGYFIKSQILQTYWTTISKLSDNYALTQFVLRDYEKLLFILLISNFHLNLVLH